MDWHTLKDIHNSGQTEITAEIEVSPESPWFAGHFPNMPILPGIAQLGIVHDIIKRTVARAGKISRIVNVRFKQTIKPNERFTITVTRRKETTGSFSFRLMNAGGLVVRGVMEVEQL